MSFACLSWVVEWPVAKQCRPKEGGGQLKASGFGWIEELECLSGVAHSSETFEHVLGRNKKRRHVPLFGRAEDFLTERERPRTFELTHASIYALISR